MEIHPRIDQSVHVVDLLAPFVEDVKHHSVVVLHPVVHLCLGSLGDTDLNY